MRLDLNGLGDSPSRKGSLENDSYPIGAGEDVSDAIDMLRTRGVSLVSLVGLCSGSVLAFDAALRREEVEHIMAINPRIDKPFHDRSRPPRSRRRSDQPTLCHSFEEETAVPDAESNSGAHLEGAFAAAPGATAYVGGGARRGARHGSVVRLRAS